MYILIDRGQMAITHKHADRAVLGKLSWIECTNAGAVMSLSSIRPLQDFTTSELKLIYKNSTGVELRGYANSLAQAVLDMAKRMPETDAVWDEVVAQAACVQDGDKSSFPGWRLRNCALLMGTAHRPRAPQQAQPCRQGYHRSPVHQGPQPPRARVAPAKPSFESLTKCGLLPVAQLRCRRC
jgi:hypothetical protein